MAEQDKVGGGWWVMGFWGKSKAPRQKEIAEETGDDRAPGSLDQKTVVPPNAVALYWRKCLETLLVGRTWSGEVLLPLVGGDQDAAQHLTPHRTAPQPRLVKPNGKTTETARMYSSQVRMEANDRVGWGPREAPP